jgi:ankyrin repeat protein
VLHVTVDLLLTSAMNDDVATARCASTRRASARCLGFLTARVRSRSIFLAHGADVNVTDEEGWRPLHQNQIKSNNNAR